MGLNVELLRNSFELVLEREPDFTHRFYDVLFAKYPQVKPMFGRNSTKHQEKMLGNLLVAVMDHIEDAAWLSETLNALGAKHVGFGVKEEMYPFVGDALITAMSQIAGPDWTDEHTTQWSAAYGVIASLMLKSARASMAPPAM